LQALHRKKLWYLPRHGTNIALGAWGQARDERCKSKLEYINIILNLPTHGTNIVLGAWGQARDERCKSKLESINIILKDKAK